MNVPHLFLLVILFSFTSCKPLGSQGKNTNSDETPENLDQVPVSYVLCVSQDNAYRLQRVTDLKLIGQSMTEEECQKSVEATRNEIVCAKERQGTGKVYKAFYLPKNHWVGRYPITQDECNSSVLSSKKDVVCAHTGVTLAENKTGWKPTNINKPNDEGFIGSSSWLEFCKKATELSHDGIVCGNGDGGTGGHNKWYPKYIATAKTAPGPSGKVEDCGKK